MIGWEKAVIVFMHQKISIIEEFEEEGKYLL